MTVSSCPLWSARRVSVLSFLLKSIDGARPLEVVPHGDLVLRLHDGVVHLGRVDLADDVERMVVGHGWAPVPPRRFVEARDFDEGRNIRRRSAN